MADRHWCTQRSQETNAEWFLAFFEVCNCSSFAGFWILLFHFLQNFRHLPQCLSTCLAVFPVRFSFSLSLYRFVCIRFHMCIYTHIWYTSIVYVSFISLLKETEHSRWRSFGQVADVCLFLAGQAATTRCRLHAKWEPKWPTIIPPKECIESIEHNGRNTL